MANSTASRVAVVEADGELVTLKDPLFAAFLAWLIPGAGHFYQGRTGKGLLFMICILGTFFFGMYLGGGRVVYASWRPGDKRLAYLCQIGVGLPALPAAVEAYRMSHDKPPLLGIMLPPNLDGAQVGRDDLARWHKDLNRYFDLGTVYTMIAGLLNILAVYDAWGGPLRLESDEPKDDKKPESG
jgi:hypothetical protein